MRKERIKPDVPALVSVGVIVCAFGLAAFVLLFLPAFPFRWIVELLCFALVLAAFYGVLRYCIAECEYTLEDTALIVKRDKQGFMRDVSLSINLADIVALLPPQSPELASFRAAPQDNFCATFRGDRTAAVVIVYNDEDGMRRLKLEPSDEFLLELQKKLG